MSDINSNPFAQATAEVITPEELESKDFPQIKRGYDPAEVQSYLRRVAVSHRVALNEGRNASAALESAKQFVADTVRSAEFQIAEARKSGGSNDEELELLRLEVEPLRLEVEELRIAAADAKVDIDRTQFEIRNAFRKRDDSEAARAQLATDLQLSEDGRLQALGEVVKLRQTIAELEDALESATTREDPYGIATAQIASMMRAADAAATELQVSSEEVLSSARLEAEDIIATAELAGIEVLALAEERARDREAKAEAAVEQCRRVVEVMSALGDQVKVAVVAANDNLGVAAIDISDGALADEPTLTTVGLLSESGAVAVQQSAA